MNMHLHPLDLQTVYKSDYLNLFVQYHVEHNDKTLKLLLAEIGVPMTSYAYARKNGFLNSKKVTAAITNYFNLSLDINIEHFEKLKELVHQAITESYFIANENLREVQKELKALKPLIQNTPLYLLYGLAYLSSIDHFVAKDHAKEELDEDILPFIEYVKSAMTKDMQYYYLFSLSEYYMVTDKDTVAISLIPEFEDLDPHVNDRLKTMGYYDLFTLYALNKNYPRAIKVLNTCQDLTFKYYNVKRLQTIRQNLTAIYYLSEHYEDALNNVLADMLYMYRQDPHEKKTFFKNMIIIIVTCLIYLERYEEALEKIKLFYEFEVKDFYDQAILLKQFCYYKLGDKKGLNTLFEEEHKTLNEETLNNRDYKTLKDLITMLHEGNKKTLKTFGERLKPLTKDTMSPYRKLFALLTKEYELYLKENNRYIDVLDMK